MATIKIDLEGVDELERKLSKLSKAAATTIAKDAVDEGGAVIQFHAQLNARNVFSDNQRGQLRNSTRNESIRNSPVQDWIESRTTATGAEAEIGPHVIYGRIQELGGTIRPVHAQALHWVIDGEDRFAKKVTIPARPYLRPAAEEHSPQITEVMRRTLADGINDAV